MKKSLHNSDKKPCRIEVFIGLCLASLFIIFTPNIISKADTFGPSGFPATPTPVPSFVSYSVSVLNYDGYSHDTPLDYPSIEIVNSNNVPFFETFLPYCISTSLENYDYYFNTSYSSLDFSDLIEALSDIYTFDPHNPYVCFNFYFSAPWLICVPDYHVNHFAQDPQYVSLINYSSSDWRIIPYRSVPTYVYSEYTYHNNRHSLYGSIPGTFSQPVNGAATPSSDPYFCLGGSLSGNPLFGTFITSNSSGWNIIDLSAYSYGELSQRFAYALNLNNGNHETYLSFIDAIPLVIMNPLYSFIDEFSTSSGSWSIFVSSTVYGNVPGIYRTGLTPSFSNYSLFEDIFNEYTSPVSWVDTNFLGLQFDFGTNPPDPLFTPTPIPTFGPIYTPTPFPTNIFNPVVTPIDLPINPVIQIGEYGSPWDFIAGIGPILSSALNSGTVRFFVTTIEYIYNSSLFFEVILLLVPSICLIAFIIGRLKRK